MQIVVNPDIDTLMKQAAAAPTWRRLVARAGLVFPLLLIAFTAGGMVMGHPFAGSLSWALAYCGGITLFCIVPLTLIERWLSASGAFALVAVLAGIVAWGLGLLGGTFFYELHHGVSGAAEEVFHLLGRLRHDARPWVLTIGPGAGIGIAAAWRRKRLPLATRYLLGLVVLLAIGGLMLGANMAEITVPKWFARLMVLGLTLPVAQIAHLVLVLTDGISMGLPKSVGGVEDGPLPVTPWVDRMLCRTHLNPWVDMGAIPLFVGAGVYELGWLAGLPLGLLVWFLMKVNFALASALWPRRLESRGLIDRAADCYRLRRHGRPSHDPNHSSATVELIALLSRNGRLEEAEVEMEGLQPFLDQLNMMSVHNLGAAWVAAGRPALGLSLLENADRKIPATLQTVWAVSRSAGLLGIDQAEQALAVLDAIDSPPRKAAAMMLYNNHAVARLQLECEPDRALELARKAHDMRSLYFTRCTLGAALAATGSSDEAVALLRPLVEKPEPGLAPMHAAFPQYWLGRVLQDTDPAESEALLKQAASLEGPWASRAAADLSASGPVSGIDTGDQDPD